MSTESSAILSHASYVGSLAGAREDKIEPKESIHFDEDLSSTDLDIAIQKERIMVIIDEMMYKSRIAICLKELFINKSEELGDILSEEDFAYVQHHHDVSDDLNSNADASNSTETLTAYSLPSREKIEPMLPCTPKPHLNPALGRTINILAKYPKVGEMVNDIIHSRQENVPPTHLYMRSLYRLRNKIHEELHVTAADELKNQVDLRNIYRINVVLKEKLAELNRQLHHHKHRYEKELLRKEHIVEKQSKTLERMQVECKDSIKNLLKESECQMILMTRAHEMRFNTLSEESSEAQKQYQTLVKSHSMNEKNIKAKRYKIESQLQSWIGKYDQEIGEKQQEVDDYLTLYDEFVQKVADIKAELAEQEKTYVPLMAEREAEYRAEMEMKLQRFQLDRAVRVVQRAWRKILEKKAKKRAGKKGKKKKKD